MVTVSQVMRNLCEKYLLRSLLRGNMLGRQSTSQINTRDHPISLLLQSPQLVRIDTKLPRILLYNGGPISCPSWIENSQAVRNWSAVNASAQGRTTIVS